LATVTQISRVIVAMWVEYLAAGVRVVERRLRVLFFLEYVQSFDESSNRGIRLW